MLICELTAFYSQYLDSSMSQLTIGSCVPIMRRQVSVMCDCHF